MKKDQITNRIVEDIISKVENSVCDYRGIKLADLKTKSNKRLISHSRYWVWYILRSLRGKQISFNYMAERYGVDSGHPNVVSGINKIKEISLKNLGDLYGKHHSTVVHCMSDLSFSINMIYPYKKCESDIYDMMEGKKVMTDPEKLLFIKKECKKAISDFGLRPKITRNFMGYLLDNLFYTYFDKDLIENVTGFNIKNNTKGSIVFEKRLNEDENVKEAFTRCVNVVGKELLNA